MRNGRLFRRVVAGGLGVLAWGTCAVCARGMDRVKLAPDGKGFVLQPSGERFIPWGNNYASVDLLARLERDPARVEREFAEMKAAGANVARIHPEMPRLLAGPDRADPRGLDALRRILAIAEAAGIRLMITGLACYWESERMPWYDTLGEADRWKAQAFFWETLAGACAGSPAVFAYDLANEPAVTGKPGGGWYTGRLGEVEFCQYLCLDPGSRGKDQILLDWTRRMAAAIRQHDPERLITLGLLPFPEAFKASADALDFISPHLYPKAGKVEDEIRLLRRFDWGKPIVIGETFPLSCSADDLRDFLLRSRGLAQGWIGHWPDESPARLEAMKQSGQATIHSAIWLSWVDLFREIGPRMTGTDGREAPGAPPAP